MTIRRLKLFALAGFPRIQAGDTLDTIILAVLESNKLSLHDGDILILAQKIVSKAEGRHVLLAQVDPSHRARNLAKQCGKDPRLVELILRESEHVVRCAPGVLIVRHRLGFVHANAGIDRSNIECADEQVLLLPEDPDGSAARLRNCVGGAASTNIGVLIIDSFGRPWRLGTCGVCIGSAGVEVIADRRGQRDLFGRVLEVTELAVADELAAAASLLMGGADEATPVVLARGLSAAGAGKAGDLIRPVVEDLFL